MLLSLSSTSSSLCSRSIRLAGLLLFTAGLSASHVLAAADPLADGFRSPPDAAKPLTFWQWMNGCVTEDGITADLESFKRAGLAGTQNFLVGGSEAVLTDPSVEVLNPKWHELMRFAITESTRLGLSFGTHNCPGWSASGGPWVAVEHSMQKIVWTETTLSSPGTASAVLARPVVDPKWNYYRDIAVLAFPTAQTFSPGNVLDLTRHLDPEGRLDWQPASGTWTVLRFGHTTTGAINGTAPVSGQGLEVDKMNRAAVELCWSGYAAKIVADAGDAAGRALARFEIDSYEAGAQDWTPEFRAEFRRRRGYDPLPWLPVLTQRIAGDADRSARFRRDWERTIKDLVSENFYGTLGDLCRRVPGMEFLLEPYATGPDEPFESSEVSAYGDILMCEFWQKPAQWGWDSVKPVASAAHTLGKRLVAAEAFTGQPQYAWLADPHALKSTGDRAFCSGVNLLVLHASAHQPWLGVAPGMTMGWWGTQFGRGQTWWDHGAKEWLTYIARCQFLLQQGRFVADLCYLTDGRRTPKVPDGFDADTIGEQTLLARARMEQGRIVLPDGISYALLVLPETPTMSPALARRLRELVHAGAIIVGPKPSHAPGLTNYPAADAEITRIADELWGRGDTVPTGGHAFGAGRVFSGQTPAEVLATFGAVRDIETPRDEPLLWIHRRLDTADIYFLSNQKDAAITVRTSFRVAGRVPELWHADTGAFEPAAEWESADGRTTVTLPFDPSGSVFVVFRQSTTATSHVAPINPESARPPQILSGRWDVRFPSGWGVPEHITLDQLLSWPNHPDRGVRYFSGTAVYTKPFDVSAERLASGRRLLLELGVVKNTAGVRLNGHQFDCLWKPPFSIDVTDYLVAGHNTLEVAITNLWPNRMIGDEYEPEDCEWGEERTFTYVAPPARIGRPLLHAPAWLLNHQPRPSRGRYTLSSFKFFTKDSPLLESGLLGPVRLVESSAVEHR